MQDTCGIHVSSEAIKIHAGYMRDTFGIHAGYVSWGLGGMYRCHHGEERTYEATHVLLVQKWVCSSTLQLLHLLLCHSHPDPCWFTALELGRARSCPGAYPVVAASRARDTHPRMYPFVSDMYRECILCVMYLRVKIHCILNVF